MHRIPKQQLINSETICLHQIRSVRPVEETMPKFTWTSPEIYRNNYVAMKFSPEGTYDKKYLCPDCLLEQWKQKIIEYDTKLDLLFPPVDTDGCATSWDV